MPSCNEVSTQALIVRIMQGTRSSKLELYCRSLKKSMKWDEDTYDLEYDLDLFNIVAVSDFNFGAMEVLLYYT
jgi:hypothetical protein